LSIAYNIRAKISRRKFFEKFPEFPIKFHENSLIFPYTKEISEKTRFSILLQEVDTLHNYVRSLV